MSPEEESFPETWKPFPLIIGYWLLAEQSGAVRCSADDA